ncbi:uncharacterized protein LOC106130157 [Amyelois transitella]|uniref:uncharacterized protein LOC106130157 n=1 Tax=Amyelois transitella TaxID=680683 RepID=UPI0029900528|nr:uncharacterized protein LOC106130157 [Amyelois transitella]
MDDKDTIEDLLDLTDSEDTTSSSSHQVFEAGRKQLILELHDLQKDEPINPELEADKRKKKKKKNKLPSNRSTTSGSSSSASDSSIPPAVADAVAKEQFYDAHESFHGLQDTQPNAALTLGQSHSAHAPKITDALPASAPATQPSSALSMTWIKRRKNARNYRL